MQITSISLFLAEGSITNDFAKTKLWEDLLFFAEPIARTAQITLILACLLTVYSGINYLIKYWDIFTGRNS